MAAAAPTVENTRGERIKFIRGSYKGKKGWSDLSKTDTSNRCYVIVEATKDAGEKATFVRRTSIKVVDNQVPKNRMDATLKENEDLEALFDDLARLCVECNLTVMNSAESVARVLEEKMLQWEGRKVAQGSKAKFRKEVWKEADVPMSAT
jgi:hypothetical protein